MALPPPSRLFALAFGTLSALALIAAKSGQAQGFVAPQGRSKQLEALAKGPVQALAGLRIELRAKKRVPEKKDLEAPKAGAEQKRPSAKASSSLLRIDLQHPSRMRVEFRRAEKMPPERIWILDGTKHWHCEADGAHLLLRGDSAKEMEALFALAMSLAHWDQLAPGAELRSEKGILLSHAKLGSRQLRVRRSACAWQIGEQRYRLVGRHGQLPRHLIGEAQSFELLRFEPGLHFLETRFDPKQLGKEELRTLRQGVPEPNFRAPKLERQKGFSYLELTDPGSWPMRLQKVHELGMALFQARQLPAGLPIYTSTGKLWIPFQGPAGKAAQAPPGQQRQELGPGLVLVLHCRATMPAGQKLLAKRLLAALRRMGRKPAGPLMLRPHVLPGDEVPGPKTQVLLRGELRVRD
ncbi:MAG: hypothetical protein CSA62_05820 [Planctomycetota bacterium]|nr:MAG: hypothetical protein CSA62_05820 [Planctomycetota bacterium]